MTLVRARALCDHCGRPSAVATTGAGRGERVCFRCRRPWHPEAQDSFVRRALAVFPGSYDVDGRGRRLPPPPPDQLGLWEDG